MLGENIRHLTVNIENSHSFNLIQNNAWVNREINYTFSRGGKHILKFVGELTNGQHFETYAEVNVIIENYTNNSACLESITYNFRSPVDFTPYEEQLFGEVLNSMIETYADANISMININENPQLDYKIYYACGRNRLENPIIITDGFDPTDSRNNDSLYYKGLQFEQNNSTQNLGDILRNNGYDVITVNFPIYEIGTAEVEYVVSYDINGYPDRTETDTFTVYREGSTDYIERNGKLLAKFIQTINDSLEQNVGTSHNGSVLVGPSMGGLITRWALTEMEQQNYDHKDTFMGLI